MADARRARGRAAAAAGLVLLAGCFGPVEKKPLFGRDDGTAEPEGPTGPPPREQEGPAAEAALVAELRRASTEAERKAIADRLVARGESSRPLVLAARDEAGLLVDLLDDVLRRLDARAGAGGAGRVDAGWVEEKHALALDRYNAGDVLGALRTIDAVLTLEPATSARAKLLRLQRRCRDRLLRESVLVADLLPGATAVPPGEPLRARVRLSNLGKEPVELRLVDGVLGVVTVDWEELAWDGQRTRMRTERRITIDDDEVEVPPGGSRDIAVDLGTPHAKLGAALAGRVRLAARLRAHTMMVGDVAYPFFVPVPPCEVVVLHRDDLPLARAPRASFDAEVARAREATGQALAEASRRAFVAAVVMARDDPGAAIEAAATALEVEGTPGPLSTALCAALARATGEPLGFSRGEWLWWWRSHKPRPARGQTPAGTETPPPGG